jgi:NAD(P)H-hydrate epimerase
VDARAINEHGWPCPTGAEMARVDADAIARVGIPARVLMETAGRAVAERVRAHFPALRRPLVACGGGNNGGDGFAIARALREWDSRYEPIVLGPPQGARQSPEARACLDLLADCGIERVDPEGKDFASALARCDLIVDALFGVGLSRPIEGRLARSIERLSASPRPIVAVDLPSGISSETGEPLGSAMRADLIVTLGLPKLGLVVRPHAAPIEVVDIGLPATSIERAGIAQHVLSRSAAARLLPLRPAAGHKGTFGHVLVVGGSPGKTGAVALAAEGALRGGAGLVTAAWASSLSGEAKLRTEAMSLALTERAHGELDASCVGEVRAALASRKALVLGPGLGRHAAAREAVLGILERCPVPACVDADGLFALGGEPERLRGTPGLVLTPHPGEAAHLLQSEVAAVQSDRVASARALAARSAAVVVLKGARSVIAAPGGEVWINPTGGPGLGTGGTGDVLAGLIGALLGQGLAPLDAARLGAYLHGLAGDLGPRAGGLAGEVAARIPAAWQDLSGAVDAGDECGRVRAFP